MTNEQELLKLLERYKADALALNEGLCQCISENAALKMEIARLTRIINGNLDVIERQANNLVMFHEAMKKIQKICTEGPLDHTELFDIQLIVTEALLP
jgi:hypothetical protein